MRGRYIRLFLSESLRFFQGFLQGGVPAPATRACCCQGLQGLVYKHGQMMTRNARLRAVLATRVSYKEQNREAEQKDRDQESGNEMERRTSIDHHHAHMYIYSWQQLLQAST